MTFLNSFFNPSTPISSPIPSLPPVIHSSIQNIYLPLSIQSTSVTNCNPFTLFITGGFKPYSIAVVFTEELIDNGYSSWEKLKVDISSEDFEIISDGYRPLVNTLPVETLEKDVPKVYSSSSSPSFQTSTKMIYEGTLEFNYIHPELVGKNITFVVRDDLDQVSFSESRLIRNSTEEACLRRKSLVDDSVKQDPKEDTDQKNEKKSKGEAEGSNLFNRISWILIWKPFNFVKNYWKELLLIDYFINMLMVLYKSFSASGKSSFKAKFRKFNYR